MITPEFLDRLWYGSHPLAIVLRPVSWLYAGFVRLRNLAYLIGILPRRGVDVPVIIVGNITVGGTGKTPLIIWLSALLREQGHRPGIISRGYGGKSTKWPQQVRADSNPQLVGDEPVLLARRTGCPVAVSPDRYVAAQELLEHTDCDVLLCDDGLQHQAMDRDLEIAVIDGDRRFGNGLCLPAGPLREPVSRLASVDMVVANGKAGRNEFLMEYHYEDPRCLEDGRRTAIESFSNSPVHVVTGLGNPARFHSWLRSHNISLIKHAFPDHHQYTAADLQFGDDYPVVMTEKDAVKCVAYATHNMWYIPINATFTDAFYYRLQNLLKDLFNG
ncbi:MAG: tetraacyldisaccharide 4'-kinase [Gammaproteobacteria bacterium]